MMLGWGPPKTWSWNSISHSRQTIVTQIKQTYSSLILKLSQASSSSRKRISSQAQLIFLSQHQGILHMKVQGRKEITNFLSLQEKRSKINCTHLIEISWQKVFKEQDKRKWERLEPSLPILWQVETSSIAQHVLRRNPNQNLSCNWRKLKMSRRNLN